MLVMTLEQSLDVLQALMRFTLSVTLYCDDKGQAEAVIEREMNVLTFEEALAHVDECTQAMRDELHSMCGGEVRRLGRL